MLLMRRRGRPRGFALFELLKSRGGRVKGELRGDAELSGEDIDLEVGFMRKRGGGVAQLLFAVAQRLQRRTGDRSAGAGLEFSGDLARMQQAAAWREESTMARSAEPSRSRRTATRERASRERRKRFGLAGEGQVTLGFNGVVAGMRGASACCAAVLSTVGGRRFERVRVLGGAAARASEEKSVASRRAARDSSAMHPARGRAKAPSAPAHRRRRPAPMRRKNARRRLARRRR